MVLSSIFVRSTTALALATLVSCGSAQALDASTERRLERAQRDAAKAVRVVDALGDRLHRAERRFARVREERRALDQRLDAVEVRLRTSLEKLTDALSEVRAESGSVGRDLESALARLDSAARDLSVLTHRFDYHLRRYHGGR